MIEEAHEMLVKSFKAMLNLKQNDMVTLKLKSWFVFS